MYVTLLSMDVTRGKCSCSFTFAVHVLVRDGSMLLSTHTARVEHGSSVVECMIRNQESPGFNPLCYHFETWAFSFSPLTPRSLSCINEYLAIDSGGNVSE